MVCKKHYIKHICFILFTLLFLTPQKAVHGEVMQERRNIRHAVYYKIDQGASWGMLMDQRMSNLHYQGPGGILNFGRRAHRQTYIAEWSFARFQYNSSKPAHKSTIVENPAAGLRYMRVWKMQTPGNYDIFVGGQVNVFGNVRLAGRLGNSFLFADIIGELRPQAKLFFPSRFLWRDWNIEMSAAASLAGYTVRIPEYGVSFELGEDGGVRIQGFEQQLLMPYNYGHFTTGIFIREKFRGENNPNWFRVGYIWDFYTMSGNHNLNVSNAMHQLVLELNFMVK